MCVFVLEFPYIKSTKNQILSGNFMFVFIANSFQLGGQISKETTQTITKILIVF